MRKIACDSFPCFAQISRAQKHGAIITRPIRIGRNVRHIRIEIRRLNTHDPLAARPFRQITRQFRPFASIVLSNPEPAIIRSSPQQTGALRRLGERKDDPVIFRATSGGICFGWIIVRQVGTDYGIFLHPLGELENAVASQINHARFVSAHDHW